MPIGSSLLALFPARSRARGGRRRAALSLRFEACESRCVLSATGLADIVAAESHEHVVTFADVSMQQEVHEGDHEGSHGGDVIGSVVDGRLVTNHRAYGYEVEPDTTVFDVGFDVPGLAAETPLQFEVMQGVTFWNGSGSTPRFLPVRSGVEMNFNNEAEDVRIGATRNVGRLLDIGMAEPVEGGTEVHDHFNVTVGRNWDGTAFAATAPTGIYVVIGRLVGDGVNPSAPIAVVLNVGASEAAHEAAVEQFDASPAVSVFGVTMPSQVNYGLGQAIQVTYRFSDPVTATGSPRLPLTIGGKPRFATLDRTASSGENVVFSYTVRAGDNGAVRARGGALGIQLPNGSRIRGAAGGTVFPQFAVTLPEMQAQTTRPSVIQVRNQTGEGTYHTGVVFRFRLEWNRPVGVEGGATPTIVVRAIRGGVLGNAEWVNAMSPTAEHVFEYTVKEGDAAPQGIEIAGPISLHGGAITDVFGNPSVLTFRAVRSPDVRIMVM